MNLGSYLGHQIPEVVAKKGCFLATSSCCVSTGSRGCSEKHGKSTHAWPLPAPLPPFCEPGVDDGGGSHRSHHFSLLLPLAVTGMGSNFACPLALPPCGQPNRGGGGSSGSQWKVGLNASFAGSPSRLATFKQMEERLPVATTAW